MRYEIPGSSFFPLEEGFYGDFPESLQARPLGEMATLLTLTLASYTETYSRRLHRALHRAAR